MAGTFAAGRFSAGVWRSIRLSTVALSFVINIFQSGVFCSMAIIYVQKKGAALSDFPFVA
jgi:hypothetical protein